jgi:tetratricopeptide (TPR) repeat protein
MSLCDRNGSDRRKIRLRSDCQPMIMDDPERFARMPLPSLHISAMRLRSTPLLWTLMLVSSLAGCRSTFREMPRTTRFGFPASQFAGKAATENKLSRESAEENSDLSDSSPEISRHDSEFDSPQSTFPPAADIQMPDSRPEPADPESVEFEPEPLSEDEVVKAFRHSGGKLKPNETGAIVEIDLSFSTITDPLLQTIGIFPEVRELDLTGTEIQDSSMGCLLSLTKLRALKLKGTKITDEGLRSLAGASELILLDASNTEITDEGLAGADRWEKLRYLSLNNTKITDAGLIHLQTLKELKGLSVINTGVTEDGVRQLKEKVPNCLIVAQTGRELSRVKTFDKMPRLAESTPLNSATVGVASHDQLSQVIRLAADQPHLAVHLSTIYASRDQWEEAVQILEVATTANPSDPNIHYALGQALARCGRPEEALPHFEQAVDEATAKYQVAMIVYENSLRSCEQLFDEAVSADPSFAAAESRRTEIQREIAQLNRQRGIPEPISDAPADNVAPEVIPAPVRSASFHNLRFDK